MKNAAAKTWQFIKNNRAYFISFLLPPLIQFVAYILFKVYPFGERSVLSLDLNAQYVYYFDYMYDVLAGKESLFYSWSRNLSGEFMGIVGYYLASPFNFIVWLFPRTMITEGLMTMMLTKTAAVGLTTCFLLKKHRGYSDVTSVIFSVMFAQCGYFIVQTMNPMWLDGLIGLPLVIMGIERICDKRRFKLYVISLVYVFVANFYIGYMIGIFSALYFLYYMSSGKSTNKCFGEVCGATLMYGLSSVAAILMSCFMILPVYKSLSNGKFTFSDPDYTPVENFNIPDIFIKLFPTTYDTVRMDGLPILYIGTLTLILAGVYFAAKRFTARERIAGAVLIGVLVVSMYVRPVDMMWHGGQMPNWLPYRYSFLISFLLLIFAAEAFENIGSIRAKALGGSFAAVLTVLLLCDYLKGHDHFDTELIILIPLGVLVVVGIMAYVFKQYGKHPAVKISLCAVVCLELLLNTVVSFYDMHSDIVFSTRASYLGDIPYTRKITDALHEMDDGFYRMEKTYHRCVNDPIALRMYGMSHSSSTLNSKSINLLKDLGYSGRQHYTRSDGMTMLTDDIFGVKYVLSKYSCYVPYTDTVGIENEINVTVYENKDALGMAYLADSGIVDFDFEEESPFVAQNKLAERLAGADVLAESPIFKRTEDYLFASNNVNVGMTTDGHNSYRKRDEDGKAWIEWDVTMPENGVLYMYLPTDYERETKLYVNDVYRSNYFKYENYSIEYIGRCEASETVRIRLEFLDKNVFCKTPQFYYIDEQALNTFNTAISQMNTDTVVMHESGTSVVVDVRTDEDCTLFTTIPYEEGWTVRLNGKRVEPQSTLNDSLICLDIPKGSHTVELDFFPAGMKTGLMLTAAGAVLFAIMICVCTLMRRKNLPAAYDEPQPLHEDEDETCPDSEPDLTDIYQEISDAYGITFGMDDEDDY